MTDMNTPECNFEEQLSALLDGELTAVEITRVERHLAGCASCQSLLVRFRSLDARLRNACDPGPSIPVTAATESMIRPIAGWRSAALPEKPRILDGRGQAERGPWGWLAGVTAVVVAGLLVALALNTARDPVRRVATPPPDVTAPPVQPVVGPLSRMALSNVTARRQQAALVRTLQFQLRALKLEMKASGKSTQGLEQIESDIDALIRQTKTRQMKTDDPPSAPQEAAVSNPLAAWPTLPV